MKSYLLIFLILCSITIAAQTYHPFPTKNAMWTQMSPNPSRFEHDIFHIYALKDKDTTINGKLYHKLYNSEDTIFTEKELCGGIREEDKKVYFYALDSLTYPREGTIPDTEYLLYDFSLKVGDMITRDNYRVGAPLSVSHIDSILIGTEYRKSIIFDYDYSYEMSWIEGIGSLRGIITVTAPRLTGGGDSNNLICFRQNNEILYHNRGYGNDCFYTSLNDIPNPKIGFKVYPNPVSGELFIQPNSNIDESFSLEIYSVKGELIKTECLEPRRNLHRIDTSSLRNGIYIVRLISDSGKYDEKVIVKE